MSAQLLVLALGLLKRKLQVADLFRVSRLLNSVAFANALNSAIDKTDEPDARDIKITTTIGCMNLYFNRVSDYLGLQAVLNAQESLVNQLAACPDSQRAAEAIRMVITVDSKAKPGPDIPPVCWEFIPKDHGLSTTEIEHFLTFGADK